jgi:hypothetical protein
MLNNTNQVGYTHTYAKAKPSLAFETTVVFYVCYYSMFGRSCIIEFSALGK